MSLACACTDLIDSFKIDPGTRTCKRAEARGSTPGWLKSCRFSDVTVYIYELPTLD